MPFSNLKDQIRVIIVLIIIGVAMWVLNYLTPLFCDDYWYPYMFIGDFFDINRPIESFKDILISQYNHYLGFNGRSVVHTIVQLFAGLLGKSVFNVLNGIAFAVFVYLLTRMTLKVSVINIIFTCAVIFLLYPEFNWTVLWMSGSVNYLWTSMVICLFIMLFERLRTKELQAKHFLWLIPSLIAGWTHEGITFPLAISLMIYAIVNYKTIRHQAVFPLIIGFVIGALFCAFAPSTIGRTGLAGDNNVLVLLLCKIYKGIILCIRLKAIWGLLFTLLILYLTKRDEFRTWFRKFYIDNIVLWNAILLSFGIVFISGFESPRAGIGVELFAVILWLRLIPKLRYMAIIATKSICCILWGGVFGLVMFYSVQNYKIISQEKPNEFDIVVTEEFNPPKILRQYILSLYNFEYEYEGKINEFVANAYNCSRIYFFPEVMWDDIVNKSDRISDISKQQEYPYYVIRLHNNEEVSRPKFILNPTDYSQVHWALRPVQYIPAVANMLLFNETELYAYYWHIVNIKGEDYLIVGKNHLIDDRVKDIVMR